MAPAIQELISNLVSLIFSLVDFGTRGGADKKQLSAAETLLPRHTVVMCQKAYLVASV